MQSRLALLLSAILLTGCEPKARFDFSPGFANPHENGVVKSVYVEGITDMSGSLTNPHSSLKMALNDALRSEGFTVANSADGVDAIINGSITSYKFVPKDDLTFVPGVCIPGCIPFGLIGAAVAWYMDDSTETGELKMSADVSVRSIKSERFTKTSFELSKIESHRSETEFVLQSVRAIAAKVAASIRKS